MTARHVAVYGGSFDPPHLGHVLSVAWALSVGSVEQVWIIPTWEHPFDKALSASFEARLDMCERAFAMFRGVRISPIERRLGGVSRTLRTVEALDAESPDTALRLLIGADLLATTARWHRWDEIVKVASPLVVGREGYPLPEGCPISIPDINSTDVRHRLANGGDVSGLVPRAVIAYIEERSLYQEAS